MRRHLDAGGVRQCRGAQPAGDAADALHVGHHVVAGLRRQRRLHRESAVKVLADLDRRAQRVRDAGAALIIIVADRLLDPGQALVVEHLAAADRFRHRQRLIVVAHQRHLVADGFAHRAHDGEILPRIGPADADFCGLKALGQQLVRLFDRGARRHDAEPLRIIGLDRLRRATEQAGQRQASAARQRIPRRHVDAGLRQPLQAGEPQQREALGQLALDLERQQLVAREQL